MAKNAALTRREYAELLNDMRAYLTLLLLGRLY